MFYKVTVNGKVAYVFESKPCAEAMRRRLRMLDKSAAVNILPATRGEYITFVNGGTVR